MPPTSEIEQFCQDCLATMLDIEMDRVQPTATFASLGLDSAAAVHFVLEVEQQFGLELHPGVTDDYPTVAEFADYLARLRAGQTPAG